MATALPLILGAGSSLMQFGARNQAAGQFEGEAQLSAEQLELEAKQEEVAAVQRLGDRKERLAKAMASQIASAGARGISAFEGSPLTVLQADIDKEQTATQRDIFQTRLTALTKRAKAASVIASGGVSSTQAKQAATFGLLGDATKIAAAS